MVWLPDAEKSLIMCLLVLTQYTNVADRLLLHAEIRVTLSHKNVAGAPYRIIVNAANSPQWLMSVAKGVTE